MITKGLTGIIYGFLFGAGCVFGAWTLSKLMGISAWVGFTTVQ